MEATYPCSPSPLILVRIIPTLVVRASKIFAVGGEILVVQFHVAFIIDVVFVFWFGGHSWSFGLHEMLVGIRGCFERGSITEQWRKLIWGQNIFAALRWDVAF